MIGNESINKEIKRNQRILVKSLVGLTILVALFSAAAGYVGYREFAQTVTEQYEESAFYTAYTATHLVNADDMDSYVNSGGTTPEYIALRDTVEGLCNSQGVTFIYVIQPDLTDYAHITFVFSTINHNSPYERYEFGYVRDTTNDEYREKYRRLYEKKSDRELVIRDRGYIETDAHITAMVPLVDSNGEVRAILCVQRQMDALNQIRRSYTRKIALTILVLMAIVLLGQGLYLYRMLISPIRRIMKEAKRFAEENVTPGRRLTETIRNRDEIGVLAEAVDQMEMQIHHYVENLTKVTAENERIGAELSLATRIQTGILPNVQQQFADRNEIDAYAAMIPAKDVGGDLFDAFYVDDDHVALVVADVSGKGIPAALFMMVTKVLIKTRVQNGDTPSQALYRVNNLLMEGNKAEMFVTVWLAVFSISTGHGVAVNAGHERPVLKRAGGEFELIDYKHEPPVALMEDIPFEEHTFEMHPGDFLFIYTDGVTEASNTEDEMFGEERILASLNGEKDMDAETAGRRVIDDINSFRGEAEQFDDITFMCFRYTGPDAKG